MGQLVYVVSWVEIDNMRGYAPIVHIFDTEEKANSYKKIIERISDDQLDLLDEIYTGKIISEIALEAIEIE